MEEIEKIRNSTFEEGTVTKIILSQIAQQQPVMWYELKDNEAPISVCKKVVTLLNQDDSVNCSCI